MGSGDNAPQRDGTRSEAEDPPDNDLQVPATPHGVWSHPVPECVGKVFVLGAELGRGGHGAVFEAEDVRTGVRYAVKLVPMMSAAEVSRARWEVGSLRLAKLPGVVRLFDDGQVDGLAYLVMERLHGGPFLAGSGTWEQVAGNVRSLVATLSWLHLAGMVHGDLKPGNVVLDRERGPVLVDFGIARGVRLGSDPDAGHRGFTRRYAAPEQLRGEPATERSDLYAVGVMLHEFLVGRLEPGQLPSRASLCRAGAPAMVAATIVAMLADDPEARPASAFDVLTAFGGEPPPPFRGDLPGISQDRPSTTEELRVLFHGPDQILHLREDGARELWLRTEGRPHDVREELAAWLRAGLARWEDGRCRIDREALTQLSLGVVVRAPRQGGGSVSRVARHLGRLRDEQGQRDAFRELASSAVVLRMEGANELAIEVAHLGLELGGRAVSEAEVDQLLCELVKATWLTQSAPVLARTIAAVERRESNTLRETLLTALGRMAASCRLRSLTGVETGPTLLLCDDDELNLDLFMASFAVALCIDNARAAEVLAEWEAWAAQTPLRRQVWAMRQGRLLRMSARFVEGCASVVAAVNAAAGLGLGVMRSLMEESSAALSEVDAGKVEEGRARCLRLLERAIPLRQSTLTADLVVRLAFYAYRAGEDVDVDDESIEGISRCIPSHGAQILMSAATHDWRAGRSERALARAARAEALYRTMGYSAVAPAFSAFFWAIGRGGRAEALEILADLRRSEGSWSFRAQGLGMLSMGDPWLATEIRPEIEALIAHTTPAERAQRREWISLDEALGTDRGWSGSAGGRSR